MVMNLLIHIIQSKINPHHCASQWPVTTPLRHTSALTRTTSTAPPANALANGDIRQQTALSHDSTIENLAGELDAVALNNRQLDEYLEHFDWEEIGEYGDEATVEMWEILKEPVWMKNARNENEDTATPFTTTRIGSHADPIPAPSRQPYPQNNDTNFPQEKRLSEFGPERQA
ncbi:hypothetical protein GN244_ATG11685 [Phytophthora infestans]|uniref:Uncharacterized protein n=1 Tax=Phytophthora infestans TaxID=4787 RepID=A0A833SQY9_PHYIN|nr:hypothetical protein GN244_ATG11685 [Phytophthora infestans]